MRVQRTLAAISLLVCATREVAAQQAIQLNDSCTVSVLNRSVTAKPDGTWVLPNVPANFGPVRARVTCTVNGQTISGESDPFVIPANGVVNIPQIHFGQTTPIPTALTVVAPGTPLTQLGASSQLVVTARYTDGSTKDVTVDGTTYTVSNSAIASVTGGGLVQAVSSGTVIIQASHEGASGMTTVQVALGTTDTDGDGIPDDVELTRGLNPNNPVDAQEDFDRDNLTNLREYQLGTDLRKADTDGDGLKDGDEVNTYNTSPLLADTDGDGVSDGLEVQSGSNPLDPASVNFAGVLTGIAVTPATFTLTFNTIAAAASVQLKVTGTLRDNTTIDLTSTARGTNYTSSDLNVCNFAAASGRVFAGVAGGCTITARIGTFTASAAGTVNTFSPVALSSVALGGPGNGLDVNGNVVYVAAGTAGLKVVNASNRSAPRIVATLILPGVANDVKLSGTRAYVAAGISGLHIVDITNPLAPSLVASVDTPGTANDVRVHGGFAFVADGPAGLQIVDVTAGTPRIVGSVPTASAALGVDVSGTLAIVAVGPAGIQVIDAEKPAEPVLLGSVDTPGDSQDVAVTGNLAYVADYTGSLRAVDFGIPTSPVLRGVTQPTLGGMLFDVALMDTFVFGADVFFVNGVPIVDVGDPDNLRPRAILSFPGDATGLGIAVDGSYVYLGTDTGQLYVGQYRVQEDLNGIPPTVAVSSPGDGATFVEGESIPVTIAASDDLAVVDVTLSINGTAIGTDSTNPYQFSVIAPVGGTNLTLTASATDLGGNVGVAPLVSVIVIPDPLTTVTGRVTTQGGQAVAAATVDCLGRTGESLANGSFTIMSVPTTRPDIVCTVRALAQGIVLGGTSGKATAVRGGITSIGDVVIGPVPVITAISPRAALSKSAVPALTVTGASLIGASFSFETPSVIITSVTVSPDGRSATLSVNTGNVAGTFGLMASTTYGRSAFGTTAANAFTVIDPNGGTDSDGDGFIDALEAILGSDPFDPTSVPDLSAPRSGEIDARSFSVLNTGGTSPAGPITYVVDAPAFTTMNLSIGATVQWLAFGTDATPFSVLNAANVTNPPADTEAYLAAFSVLNQATGVVATPTAEASGLAFSVLNTAATVSPLSSGEVAVAAFSVFNASNLTGSQPTGAEVTAKAFSVLNTANSTIGSQPTLTEVNGRPVSVFNITGLPEATVTVTPESSPALPAGTAAYPAYVSATSNPVGPFGNQSVWYAGYQNGGSSETLNGAHLVYRVRIDFARAVRLDAVAVSGLGDYSSGGNNAVLRILDANGNVLAILSTSRQPCCSESSYILAPGNLSGQTFFIDEFDYSTNGRYRSHIALAYRPQ